ncbi:unnamed protein product [Rotaria sp. Silwood1]|nr:unnamed protein product [Rotaria sp. Silwood1]
MGTGSSRSKVKKFDKSSQIPPIIDRNTSPKRYSLSSSRSNVPLFSRASPRINKQQPTTQSNVFKFEDNIEEYSTIWDDDNKVSYYLTDF